MQFFDRISQCRSIDSFRNSGRSPFDTSSARLFIIGSQVLLYYNWIICGPVVASWCKANHQLTIFTYTKSSLFVTYKYLAEGKKTFSIYHGLSRTTRGREWIIIIIKKHCTSNPILAAQSHRPPGSYRTQIRLLHNHFQDPRGWPTASESRCVIFWDTRGVCGPTNFLSIALFGLLKSKN